jgi:Tfp pilus assembly protein PilO
MFLKVLVGGVLLGIEVILFWLVMWQPINNKIVVLDQQITTATAQYQKDVEEAQNLEKWEKAKVAFQDVLTRMHQKPVPMKDFIPTFLIGIEKLARSERESTGDPSFQVTSITPGAVQVQSSQGQNKGQTPPSGAGGASGSPNEVQAIPVATGTTVIQLNFTGRFKTIVDFLQELGNFKLNQLVTIQKISLTPQSPKPGEDPVLSVTMPFQVYMLGGG